MRRKRRVLRSAPSCCGSPQSPRRGGLEMSLRDWPIKQKLTAILLLISGLVLFLTAAAFVTYAVVAFRQMTLKDLSTPGRSIAANRTASVAFASVAAGQA